MSHKHSCSSWWWTWRGPKHVEVINKNWWNLLRILRTTLVSFTRLCRDARRGPKHVEVINKIDETYSEYCAPRWFHLQDYVEMRGQQNINFNFSSILSCCNTSKFQKSSLEPSYLTSFLPVTINTFFHTPLCLISC